VAEAELLRLPPETRWVVQGMPVALGRAGARAGGVVLGLGPDEALVLGGVVPPGPSVVEVSDRQEALEVSGAAARLLLTEGVPLDLDDAAFPVGACARTRFGKVAIVLWRVAEARWRLEVARSLVGYVEQHLVEALRDL
jgi:sarcosine oxidase subunit gamma